MPAQTHDEGLRAARTLVGALRAHDLLGCDWGLRVSTKDERGICSRQAMRLVVVHDGPVQHELKLCDAHFDRVAELTDPHKAAPDAG